MKKAVIIVGEHFAGKSKTINKFLKPILKLGPKQRSFTLENLDGIIYSQSLEEKFGIIYSQSLEEKSIDEPGYLKIINKVKEYNFVIMAARPENEPNSLKKNLVSDLRSRKFKIKSIDLIADQSDSYYNLKAKEAYQFLIN
ncbi:hypothetical protein EHQ23_02410 [Leptospira bourretii]|uniref:Uncharacterized protein n=1 Tax=Leptospira bourretii TaxID=2484962 RepID=A0A4R9IMN2_9LEPT|nr:hypothetical protein [Leptospira bourretii]TGK89989.1 hypothetical protein EHQ23_02410 [Leptospira bourretii]TGK92212.1 hypothetical protein EHQ26_09555 [Leptospira bourretii]TGL27491.1 hypothetical protein EHQ45_17505 [Leptospira bourretii]